MPILPVPQAAQPLKTARLDALSPQTISLWLHGKSAQTQRAYRRDIGRLLTFTGKPLVETTLADLQAFADSLAGLAESSRTRTLAAVKSLFAFESQAPRRRLSRQHRRGAEAAAGARSPGRADSG
jgi:hypothetical protein